MIHLSVSLDCIFGDQTSYLWIKSSIYRLEQTSIYSIYKLEQTFIYSHTINYVYRRHLLILCAVPCTCWLDPCVRAVLPKRSRCKFGWPCSDVELVGWAWPRLWWPRRCNCSTLPTPLHCGLSPVRDQTSPFLHWYLPSSSCNIQLQVTLKLFYYWHLWISRNADMKYDTECAQLVYLTSQIRAKKLQTCTPVEHNTTCRFDQVNLRHVCHKTEK